TWSTATPTAARPAAHPQPPAVAAPIRTPPPTTRTPAAAGARTAGQAGWAATPGTRTWRWAASVGRHSPRARRASRPEPAAVPQLATTPVQRTRAVEETAAPSS